MGVQYLVQLKLPKELDDKVMRKLAEAKSLYPKVSKNGIILGVIERGLKYLSKKTLVPHSKEKAWEQVEKIISIQFKYKIIVNCHKPKHKLFSMEFKSRNSTKEHSKFIKFQLLITFSQRDLKNQHCQSSNFK